MRDDHGNQMRNMQNLKKAMDGTEDERGRQKEEGAINPIVIWWNKVIVRQLTNTVHAFSMWCFTYCGSVQGTEITSSNGQQPRKKWV